MVLEVATLDIHEGQESAFEDAMRQAAPIIMSSAGYINHEIHRCIERPSHYILFVRWNTLEDHMVGFRGSPQLLEWRAILSPFYSTTPLVEHYNQTHQFSSE